MPAKPRLGQNFLVDQVACERIAAALGDTSTRTVVEIGPGHGAITGILASPSAASDPRSGQAVPRCARLHCIEFDPALARELTFRFRNDPHVSVHHADILQTDLAQLASGDWHLGSNPQTPPATAATPPPFSPPPSPHSPASLDIIGNLPYYITSDILLHLFAAARAGLVARAVLMMQREVADRVAAAPGSSQYGALSAATQMHAHVVALFTLPPSAFSPPPEVFSTVVRLDFAPRFAELGVDPAGFNRFLRASFAQKRKTLANNLRAAGYTAAQLAAAWPPDLAPQVRSEAVALEPMAALYKSLGPSPSPTAA